MMTRNTTLKILAKSDTEYHISVAGVQFNGNILPSSEVCVVKTPAIEN